MRLVANNAIGREGEALPLRACLLEAGTVTLPQGRSNEPVSVINPAFSHILLRVL